MTYEIENLKNSIFHAEQLKKENTRRLKALNDTLELELFNLKSRTMKLSALTMSADDFMMESEMILDKIKELRGD